MRRSPPFDRTLALACRLETFRANWIAVQCCRCRPPLAADARRDARKLADFLIRLRSQACGARPASAVLVENVAGQTAARARYGAQGGWWLSLLPE